MHAYTLGRNSCNLKIAYSCVLQIKEKKGRKETL